MRVVSVFCVENQMITVDSNTAENYFSTALANELGTDCTVDRRSLPVGDIDIQIGDVRLLLERKSVADLCSSVCDGRYESQMQRARDTVAESPGLKFGLLITGELPAFNDPLRGVPASTIYSILTKVQLRDSFVFLHSNSVEDGAKVVAQLVRNAKKDGFAPKVGNTQASSKLGKRPHESMHDPVAAAIAGAITGVSIQTAGIISKEVSGSIGNLIALPENDLARLKIGKRMLGPVLAAKVKVVFK